nr:hypothetical protein [Pseudopedobacter sp.]
MGTSKNPLLKDFRGHIDKTIVVKQYPGDRIILTAYPAMNWIKPMKPKMNKYLYLKMQ